MYQVKLWKGDRPSRAGLLLRRRLRNTYTDKPVIVNWGCTRSPSSDRITEWFEESLDTPVPIINAPIIIKNASNKLETFRAVDSNLTIPWSTDLDQARLWSASGYPVYCRTQISASRGRGIVVAHNPRDLVPADLYTRYVEGREFRVHLTSLGIFDIQEKRRRHGERPCTWIKNHGNGWILARRSLNLNDWQLETLHEVSSMILTSIKLDFVCLDLILNEEIGWCLLETNSAPALINTTLENYTKAISKLCQATIERS